MDTQDRGTDQPVPTVQVAADLAAIARAMRSVADGVGAASGADEATPLEALVRATLEQVPGARSVSVTVLRGGTFRTEASTDSLARRADALQYEIGSGPCVDAILDDSIYRTDEVSRDERWARWGARVSTELGVRSVLAYRLGLPDDSGAIAALNVYSDQPAAFDERALGLGLVLATHGSLVVTALLAREQADNLLKALASNREIGVAMGILMHRHGLDREQAFAVLRVASQDSNRKLADVAGEVADTGILAVRGWPLAATEGGDVADVLARTTPRD